VGVLLLSSIGPRFYPATPDKILIHLKLFDKLSEFYPGTINIYLVKTTIGLDIVYCCKTALTDKSNFSGTIILFDLQCLANNFFCILFIMLRELPVLLRY